MKNERYWLRYALSSKPTVQVFRKEVRQGFDEKTVKNVLMAAGLLRPGNDGKPSQVVRVPGLGSSRVYVIRYREGGE